MAPDRRTRIFWVEPGVGSRFSIGPVSIRASTDIPGRTSVPSAGFESSTIFTG
ncbi:MAG: hypothetical protein QOH05_2259, partial [Acetobacteraceae bacterium]|nr:hypothetical protein [Acetobacteraceae bacterium]